ncbi:MAG: choloylglycine hydrolase family protein [Smithellaceae bacterium]|nr:choloylglycine hydrolase family protein [Smithellaceae bacterium]
MKKIILSFIAVFLLIYGHSFACTDFQVKAEDGSIVIGRSMEFMLEMGSEIITVPRGEETVSMTPEGKKGISWRSKYGFLGINALGLKRAVLDGINEAGLSVEFLWFPGSAYNRQQGGDFIVITDLGLWLLGNFATVEEVKKAIADQPLVGVFIPQIGQIPGFHVAVHDAGGRNLVIEFINGEKRIYDNPIGVMTNRPTFDWHLANLRNYLNLTPTDKDSETIAGVVVEASGSGNGWLGLPGDWMPPSRFVRTVKLVHAAKPVKNASEAVNLAEHILNAVDIPLGVIKAQPAGYDYTQWSVIKDLTNRIVYYRSYRDLALKRIDMKALDFNPGAAMKTLPIADGGWNTIDVTGQLK